MGITISNINNITIAGNRRGASGPNGSPSNLVATIIDATTCQFDYLSTSLNQDGYRLYISSDGGINYIEKTTSSNTRITVTDFTSGVAYKAKIVAYKGDKESDPSNIVDFATINSSLVAGWNFEYTNSFNDAMQDLPYHPLHSNSAQYFNGKTYIVYSGNDCDPYIITYTHATSTWSTPVKIGTNPLLNSNLGHGEPSMLITSDGYIHVMWGAHTTTLKYAKSTNVEDISAWTAMTDPIATASYPQLIELSDGIYLFFRKTSLPAKDWGYMKSTDGGANWSAYVSVCTYYAYVKFTKGEGDFVHCSVNGYNTTAYDRFNVYYFNFDGTDWKNIEGDTLTLPLDDTSDILVRNTGANYVPLTACAFDSSNNPYIIFAESITASDISTYNYKLAKYISGAWSINNLGISSDKFEDCYPSIEHTGGTNISAYLVAWGLPDSVYGNIQKWISTDNGTSWSISSTIKSGQLGWPILVKDHHVDAKIVFSSYRNGATTTWYSKGFVWGDSGFLNNVTYSNILDNTDTYPIFPSGTLPRIIGTNATFLQFTGSPNYAYSPDNDIFSFNGGSPDKPFSVSFWLYITGTSTTQFLFGKNAVNNREWNLDVSSNTMRFLIQSLDASKIIYATAPFTTINQEVFIIGTYDGSGNESGIKIYINNNEAQTIQTHSGVYAGMGNGTANLGLGTRDAGADQFLTGRIAKPRIWNKVLSTTEMTKAMSGIIGW